MDENKTWQKLLAEFLGTAFLVFVGVGSVPALAIARGDAPFTGAELGVISAAFATVVVVTVYVFGYISGNHINPAVTLALAVAGRFSWREVPGYLLAQLVGATVGAFAIVGALGGRASDLGLGIASYGPETPVYTALIAESLGTFVLVVTVLGVVHRRASAGFAGIAVGFVVFAVIVATGPSTGGSINPARTTGPMIVQTVLGGEVHWEQWWVYVLAQLVGGAAAAVAFGLVTRARPEPVAAVPRS